MLYCSANILAINMSVVVPADYPILAALLGDNAVVLFTSGGNEAYTSERYCNHHTTNHKQCEVEINEIVFKK